ncbi:TolC family protein [Pyxidicoccus sp. MSG2]|uniref:TolC family protein n=1 Tax=Pyxidicoccus sp. MSG2 TaxID=2996790 RepID=UPI00227053C2|nr:TolC family protein [Pyxidicoccus sp. MSG2]MCY1022586.1 TolC family protein [Pyxidicoccus sp. MSG2]
MQSPLAMKTPQTAWSKKRPHRMTALALGFLGLVSAPGVGLAQAPAEAQPQQQRPEETPQPRPAVSVTLEEAIARALKTSPQVAQAAGTVTTSEAAERSAFGAYLPSLSANASSSLASSNRLDPETGAVTSGSNDTYSAGLSAGWDVFTGGQRGANSRQAKAQSSAAEAQLTAQQSSAVLDVERSFYEVLRAQGLEEVARSRIERAKGNAEAADRRLAVGSATRSDVLRSQLELTTAREALLTAQTQRDSASLALGRLIGEDGAVDAKPLDNLDPKPLPLTEDALVNEIAARAPSVLAAEANLRSSEAGVGAAKSEYLPSVRLSAGYDWFNQDLAFTGGRTSWSVRLGLSYPIFDGFLREERVVRARTQESVSQAQLADTRRAVRSGVGQSLSQLRLTSERINFAKQSVEVAQEDVKVQQERYRLGATTILELLTSQESLVQAQINLVAARFDYQIARAELEALAGRRL